MSNEKADHIGNDEQRLCPCAYIYNIRAWFVHNEEPGKHVHYSSEHIATVEVMHDVKWVDIKYQPKGAGGPVKQITINVPYELWDMGRITQQDHQRFLIVDPKKRARVLPSKGVTPVWFDPEESTQPLESLPTKGLSFIDDGGRVIRRANIFEEDRNRDGICVCM